MIPIIHSRSPVPPLLLAAVATAILLLLPAVAAACPGCADALPAGSADVSTAGTQGNLAAGFFWSILFMMAMPFTLAAAFGGAIYYLMRRTTAIARGTEATVSHHSEAGSS